MSQLAERPTTLAEPRRSFGSTYWRVAGGLGLAHIVVMLCAFAVEGVSSVEHGTAYSKVLQTYAGVSEQRVFLASYVEAMAFVILVPALIMLGRLFSQRSETGRIAAPAFVGLGIAYVGATLAVGFAPLTTAVYAAHHGVGAQTVATINDLRNYGFLLQVALTMAFTLALGVAALTERSLVKWVGWGGVGVGVVGLAMTPFAHNAMSMVQMIWWVGLCVLCLKGGPKAAAADSPGSH